MKIIYYDSAHTQIKEKYETDLFGRHHGLFNYCSQIQISQQEKGYATVYYVSPNAYFDDKTPNELFDSNDIDMNFDFIRIDRPIRTKTGKVLLFVDSPQQEIK